MKQPILKKIEILLIFLVLFSAFFWRFINYSNRWTLSQDQARDAIIALEAIKEKSIPLMGPPSSAGSFSFGPIYYWLIIVFTLLTPNLVSGPWIGFTLLSCASVILFYLLGRLLEGKSFALILGLISSFAVMDVFNAPDMLNPMPVGFLTTLSFISVILLLEKRKLIYSLPLGLTVGLAINFHLQSLGLLAFFPLCIFLNNFKPWQRFKIILGLGTGIIISFIPLIYFDLIHKGAWISSIFQYLTTGQNKFNNQITPLGELTTFWPKLWGEVIFNQSNLGYFLIGLLIISSIIILYKTKTLTPKSVRVIFLSFIIQIFALHFYKGPRLPVYLIIFHPYLIFLLGYCVWVIWRYQRLLGIILLLIILVTEGLGDLQIINTVSQAPKVLKIKEELESKIKGPFDIYSYTSSFNLSLPLFYLLQKQGKTAEDGIKIGACDYYISRAANLSDYDENCPSQDNIVVIDENLRIYSLKDTSNLFRITPKKIYSWLYDNYSH